MVTEEAVPYATTAESHYAKEDTDSMQAQRGASSCNFVRLVGEKRVSPWSFGRDLRSTSIRRRRETPAWAPRAPPGATVSPASLDSLALLDQRC